MNGSIPYGRGKESKPRCRFGADNVTTDEQWHIERLVERVTSNVNDG